MPQELEIEFKNMLTKDEFFKLADYFNLKQDDFREQTNYYFDTEDFLLKQLRAGLRIRKKGSSFECTLKEPFTGIGLMETTDRLTASEADSFLKGEGPLAASEVNQRLEALKINIKDLNNIGTLITKRAEIKYEGGLLVLDHSNYGRTEDYELEYEVSNEEKGKATFLEFLASHSIPIRPAEKKIARLMNAKK